MTDLRIIAIGASAGGLEALQDFLSKLPPLEQACIVVAQHLSPTHKSMLVQLLSRETKLVVAEAAHGSRLEASKVYITPPDKEITIQGSKIHLAKPAAAIGPKPSVDVLFQSLAHSPLAAKSVGIILSGTGSDGAKGIEALKAAQAYVLVQEPATAKYDGMPLAAMQTGLVDAVLPPERMGAELAEYFEQPDSKKLVPALVPAEASPLGQVLQLLGRRTGTDFSNYKTATLGRRLEKRMAMLNVPDLDAYLALLAENPREQDEMFNMMLIGVTAFFRDPDAFQALEARLREMLAGKAPEAPIRIWAPGCSTGEEAYSIAIVLSRLLKERVYRANIQIFATDIDERAIAVARRGVYPAPALDLLAPELRDVYFVKKGEDYELIKAVRSLVLFSKHDLISNPPFLKLDLISCRNLLIYFNAALQQQVIPLFHYALNPEGLLFLGKSESVGNFGDLFATLDGKNKIFQRKRGGQLHAVRFSAFKAQKGPMPKLSEASFSVPDLSLADRVRETLFNTFEHPYVVVDEAGDIREVSGDVRLFLGLRPGSIQVNLVKMVNPELQIELRAVLSKAMRERSGAKSEIKRFELFGAWHYVRLQVKPLMQSLGSEEHYIVIFEKLDIEDFVAKGSAVSEEDLVNARILELEHELAATKEHLQTYIEEIETSNEELQSLNEELQSTNEELQSSNEELETSNEELQSTNEEVQIAYAELKVANENLEEKDRLLEDTQADTQALLNNGLQAFVLIGAAYTILRFNAQAERLFWQIKGRAIQAGESFIDMLPTGQVESFIEDFGQAMKGGPQQRELQLDTASGARRWYALHYTPVAVGPSQVRGVSLGLLDVSDLKEALSKLNGTERLVAAVFDAVSTGICISDERGILVDVNTAYCQIYGYQKEELIGQSFAMVASPKHRAFLQQMHDDFIAGATEAPAEFEVLRKNGEHIIVTVSAQLLVQPDGRRFKVTSVKDITADRYTSAQLKALMGNLTGAIVRYELRPSGIDRLVFISEGAQAIWGLDAAACLADNQLLWARFQPEDRARFAESLRHSAQHRQHWTAEWRYWHPDGTWRWQRGHGNPQAQADGSITWDAIVMDVTEEKQARYGLQHILDQSLDIICTLSRDGHFVQISAAWQRILGHALEDVEGRHFGEFIHPDDLLRTTERGEAVVAGQLVASFENRYRHQDGHFVSIIWSARWDEAQQLIYCVGRDATQQKLAEEKVRTSEALMAEAQRLAKMGSWSFDFATGRLLWSDALYDVFGIGREDFHETHDSFLRLVDPQDRERVKAADLEAQLTGQPFNIEYSITTPAGERRVIEEFGFAETSADGQVRRVFGTAQDITERRRAEEALRASHERFRYVTKATSDVIWDWDLLTGQMYLDESHDEQFGTMPDRETLDVESRLLNRLHPDEHDGILGSFKTLLADKGSYWSAEHRYKKSDGSYAFVLNKAFIIRDAAGRGIRAIGALRDITRRKAEEQRLRLMESVIANTNDAVLITEAEPFDEPGPRIVYVNEAFTRMTGYTAEEAIGRSPRFLQGEHSDHDQLARLGQALRRWEPGEVTTINYKKNGEPFWINFSVNPVADEKGWFTHWVAIERDVTKREQEILQKRWQGELGTLFQTAPSLQASVEALLAYGVAISNAVLAEFWRHSSDGQGLYLAATLRRDGQALPDLPRAKRKLPKSEAHLAVAACHERQVLRWVPELHGPAFAHADVADNLGVRAGLALPLLHGKDCLGVLVFATEDESGWFNFFAQAADALRYFLGGEFRRKQLEEELQLLFTTAPDLLCVGNLQGYFTKINPAATQLLGYDEAELLSRPFLEFVHPEDVAHTEALIRTLVQDARSIYLENRFVGKQGQVLWLSWSVTRAPGSGLVFAIAKDITRQKVAEGELKASVQTIRDYQAALDRYFNVLLSDLKGNTLDVNERTCELSGYSREELIGAHTRIHKSGLHDAAFYKTMWATIGRGEIWRGELCNRRKDGSLYWVDTLIVPLKDAQMRPYRYLAIRIDISERKAAAQRLQAAYEEKDAILSSIGDAFFSVDRDWTVTYWNQMAEKLTKVPAKAILNTNLWNSFEEAVELDAYRICNEAMEKQEPAYFELFDPRSKRWMAVSIYPSGEGLSIYFRDVSERVHYTQAIEEQNAKLRDIAWTQSHIVRAPLARMMGLIYLLKDEETSLDDKIAMLGMLEMSAHELDAIVQDIVHKSQSVLPKG